MASSAPEILALAFVIAIAAGLVRGITGFGGALVMTPPLALLFTPAVAVPVALLLESVVSAPMLAQTRQEMRWRVIGPILVAACLAVPAGAYLLASADPDVLRRAIAAVVIVFSLLLLRGWRYTGRQRMATSIATGALAGTMGGATSMCGPPVILYLLSGPDAIATTRANLTLFVAVASLAALIALWANGVLDARAGWTGLALAPAYLGGLLVGARAFSRFNDARFRQFTLLVLVGVSIGILLA